MSKGKVKLSFSNIHDYRASVRLQDANDMKFNNYQCKEDKAFRVVMRGWHYKSDLSYLKDEVEAMGYKVRSITNIKGKDKKPLHLFYLDLEPSTNDKNI